MKYGGGKAVFGNRSVTFAPTPVFQGLQVPDSEITRGGLSGRLDHAHQPEYHGRDEITTSRLLIVVVQWKCPEVAVQ